MVKKFIFSITLIISVLYLQAQKLTIELDNIRNHKGEISVTVYNKASTWLDDELDDSKYAFPKDSVIDKKLTVSLQLDKPGKYGIAVLDDENMDGKMRKNFIGYPKEGFGFSNNIHVWLSRPKFDECALYIEKDTTIRITMQYK